MYYLVNRVVGSSREVSASLEQVMADVNGICILDSKDDLGYGEKVIYENTDSRMLEIYAEYMDDIYADSFEAFVYVTGKEVNKMSVTKAALYRDNAQVREIFNTTGPDFMDYVSYEEVFGEDKAQVSEDIVISNTFGKTIDTSEQTTSCNEKSVLSDLFLWRFALEYCKVIMYSLAENGIHAILTPDEVSVDGMKLTLLPLETRSLGVLTKRLDSRRTLYKSNISHELPDCMGGSTAQVIITFDSDYIVGLQKTYSEGTNTCTSFGSDICIVSRALQD